MNFSAILSPTRLALLSICLLLPAACATTVQNPAPVNEVLVQRAAKIAAGLSLTDPAQTAPVRDLIARQYHDLSLVHDRRDAAIKAAQSLTGSTKDNAIKQARDEAEAAQNKLHDVYLAKLAGAGLTPAQIDGVKDGMTYGVLPLTFRVYQEMLPAMTAEQKAKILGLLTEARDHAMNASTSDEKHGWFGKYKGRINNYLSAAGIDMKQAEKEMLARQKAGSTK